MALRQSRRTISINGQRRKAAAELAARLGVSLSTLTEYVLELAHQPETQFGLSKFVAARASETEARYASQRKPVVPKPEPEPKAPSRSAQAAWHRHRTGCTLAEAGSKFGVTAVAVLAAGRSISFLQAVQDEQAA